MRGLPVILSSIVAMKTVCSRLPRARTAPDIASLSWL
jgi:hypothetical protein